MPTNVIDAGHARTYGSGWSTAGQAINEGLGQVLGYYQEYQRQKRFELQQQQEQKLKAQEMAERAEEKKWINEERMDVRNARKAAQAERDALMLTEEQALAMPEYTSETKTMVPKETLKLTTPADPELGIPEQTTEMPSFSQKEELKKQLLRTKKYGDYTAVLDWGGEQARRAKEAERQADWVTLPNDLTLPNGLTYKAGTKVPPTIAAAGNKASGSVQHIQDPVTGQIWGLDEKTGTFTKPLGKIGVKADKSDKPDLLDAATAFRGERDVRRDFAKATENARKTGSFSKDMNMAYQDALRAEKEGTPLNAQSQVIITMFNKITDPNSVVRESEYARSAEGQAVLEAIQGKIQQWLQGGAGMTTASLKNIVDMADMMAKRAKDEAIENASQVELQMQDIIQRRTGRQPTPEEVDAAMKRALSPEDYRTYSGKKASSGRTMYDASGSRTGGSSGGSSKKVTFDAKGNPVK